MTPNAWQSRLLVPRWRSLADTLRSGELGSPRIGTTQPPVSADMAARLERWQLAPSLVGAAELVEAALLEGQEKMGVDAAKRLLSVESTAVPLIKAQALSLLRRAGQDHEAPSAHPRQPRQQGAANIRRLSRLNPRDALNWVELAFIQTIRGHPDAASRSMSIALGLAPDNRHVLRSASRLFLHRRDVGKAHDLLLRSAATPGDPWLMAGEIALAELNEKSPRFFKQGLRLLDDSNVGAHQTTELAGAAATRELLDGSRKRSKRLFLQSMIAPTGSSLAQAEWATPHLGAELVDPSRLQSTTEPFEAEAFHLYRAARFHEVPSTCENWARVDPFSIRPFEFGSMAAGHAGDLRTAEVLAREGLAKRPNSPNLLNCLAYALASSDRPEEAERYLKQVRVTEADRLGPLSTANRGLIEFRKGNIDEGIALYRKAISDFNRLGLKTSSAHARVYLAREASLSQIPDAAKFLSEAQVAMKPFANSEAIGVLRDLEIKAGQQPSDIPTHISAPESDTSAKPTPLQKAEVKWITPGWTPPWKS